MNHAKTNPIQPDWWSKTLAGILLGFLLALGVTGVFALLTQTLEGSTRAQLTMWLLMPVWITVLSCCYFFRDGLRAWLWLGLLNLLLWAPQLIIRFF